MKMEIDVAEFAANLKSGKGIGGKDGALTPPYKITYRDGITSRA
jgi:putative transposase